MLQYCFRVGERRLYVQKLAVYSVVIFLADFINGLNKGLVGSQHANLVPKLINLEC